MRISDWSSDVCSSDLFASHFAPDAMDEALALYRRDFRPSARLQQPYAMLGLNVVAADSDAEEIGRASCRERVCQYVSISVVAVSLQKKIQQPDTYIQPPTTRTPPHDSASTVWP